jgi:hypothetical protein
VMVALSLCLFVIGGVIASHQFGLKMMEIIKTKLDASNASRDTLNWLVTDVRSAKSLQIGTGGLTSFTGVSPNTLQQANALQVYASTNTNTFVRYFLDPTDKKLKRMTNGANSAFTLTGVISNTAVFTTEDYAGNILTNDRNNCVVGLNLQFSKLVNGNVSIGPTNYFKSFRLAAKIAHRTVE